MWFPLHPNHCHYAASLHGEGKEDTEEESATEDENLEKTLAVVSDSSCHFPFRP